MTNSYMPFAVRRFRRTLVFIFVCHLVSIAAVMWALYLINLANGNALDDTSDSRLVLNASMFGFWGSLLFFSRKAYVYLISDKLSRALVGQRVESDEDRERLRSMAVGYYAYLLGRPIGGMALGLLLFLFVRGGLSTLAVPRDGTGELAVSLTGSYVVYLLAFVGGYSSSDLFDYLSGQGRKLTKKLQIS